MPNKILALQVEIGELANEWRGFKHWISNPSPRYERKCHACKGVGSFPEVSDSCGYCGGTGVEARPLLEEYVDCLHFILSIGIDSGFEDEDELEYVHVHNIPVFKNPDGILEQFQDVFHYINEYRQWMDDSERFQDIVMAFISLGEMLGFTWEQIEQAYNEKREENVRLQDNGY